MCVRLTSWKRKAPRTFTLCERLGSTPSDLPSRRLILTLALDFRGADLVPRVERDQRVVVGHVAPHRRDGDVTALDGIVVRPLLGRLRVILFADPVVSLAAWVNVLANDGPRVFDALPRDTRAAYLPARDVDVEQRTSGGPVSNVLRTATTAKRAASVKSKFSRATRLKARPGTPRMVASARPRRCRSSLRHHRGCRRG